MKKQYIELLNNIKNPLCPHLGQSLLNQRYATAYCQIELDIKNTEELLGKLKELKELIEGEL